MKHSFAASLAILAAATAFGGVDPDLLGLMVPDAKVVSGIQVAQVRTSPLGQYLLSQVPENADLEKIMSATGFDPRRDLHELVASSGDPQHGIVAGRGVFQPARIASAAVLAGAVSSKYKGFELLTGGTGPQTASAAFLDNTLVVFGSTDAVKAAIDRRTAGAKFSGSLSQKAMEAGASNDAWFVTAESLGNFLDGHVPNQNLGNINNAFQAILQTSGGVKFASSGVTVALAAVARSAQDAQSLVDVAKFFTSLVQLNRDKNPGAAKVATLADAATFTANGAVATFTVSLPEQQLEQWLTPTAPSNAVRHRRVARR